MLHDLPSAQRRVPSEPVPDPLKRNGLAAVYELGVHLHENGDAVSGPVSHSGWFDACGKPTGHASVPEVVRTFSQLGGVDHGGERLVTCAFPDPAVHGTGQPAAGPNAPAQASIRSRAELS